MRIGSVVAPGPVVKLAITRSSSDSVKASIQPAATAGKISGSVMVRNALSGGQPRSIAASVPSSVAAVADSNATRRLTHVAASIALSLSSSTYQRVDQPAQTVTKREALNE